MTKQRALITGVTGMVGSHLVDYLLENTDWDIYGCCRWRSPLDNVSHLLDRVNRKDRLFFIDMDLTDSLSVSHAVDQAKPDYVFHLAAQSYPKVSFTSPLVTLDTNIQGTERLLTALQHHADIDPVIHVCSSSEVFGRVPKEQLPISETNPFHPASPYAISKVGTDLLGRYHAESYGQKIMVTRMFTHTGPRRGDVFAESTFAKQIAMIEQGLQEPVVKTGNVKSLRTWADVRDAVRAYYMLVTMDPQPGEAYNIGGTYSCTVEEMLHYLISLSPMKDEIKHEVEDERLRPLDADLQLPDTSKFTSHTGWKPEISFEETMQDLLNYWRERVKKEGSFLSR
ncbi:GDP-mannose 4,6-dehydratase [Pseudodesulfovibrio sp. zrk46]|uniref:GDP-mannose 4,6-dehydratase n=1 Tax=Pseudodesulfovibrio sp. zrk46 TaxID=2725288 RepID=UPI001448E092|nr:GDP-mannose 4,6-dehydratase [Pseudodesulfovibrio sp. zrk46]QJB55749.1 GDP-mannose 4,6-dehydratase [Pseudodesulfovibrio sp. zrk46]